MLRRVELSRQVGDLGRGGSLGLVQFCGEIRDLCGRAVTSVLEPRGQLRHLSGRATLGVIQLHLQVRNLCSRSLLDVTQLVREFGHPVTLCLELCLQLGHSRVCGCIVHERGRLRIR